MRYNWCLCFEFADKNVDICCLEAVAFTTRRSWSQFCFRYEIIIRSRLLIPITVQSVKRSEQSMTLLAQSTETKLSAAASFDVVSNVERTVATQSFLLGGLGNICTCLITHARQFFSRHRCLVFFPFYFYSTQLNSTQRASMDAGVKTPQCPHLSIHFCISSTTINLIRVLICRRFWSSRP